MHILPIVIAVVIVFIGSLTNQQKNPSDGTVQGDTLIFEPTVTPTETLIPTTTSIPTPTLTQKHSSNMSLSIEGFRYPNATVKVSSDDSLILESNENPDIITDWYKDNIRSIGMNAKSFVTTKTNDKIKNVLVGANGNIEVRVEISKNPGKSETEIVVTIKSS